MLNFKKLIVSLFFVIYGGSTLAQGPTVTVTFKSDATVTEPIEITLGRQTLTLPAFVTPGGSSVSFRSGLRFNTENFLDAIARKSNIKSKSYTFSISTTNPTVTITTSINSKLPLNEQITFQPDSGRLLPRTVR